VSVGAAMDAGTAGVRAMIMPRGPGMREPPRLHAEHAGRCPVCKPQKQKARLPCGRRACPAGKSHHFLPAPPMATRVLIVPAAVMTRRRAF
jgi:hypothetical protein